MLNWEHYGFINTPLYQFISNHGINTVETKVEPYYFFNKNSAHVTSGEWKKRADFLNKLIEEATKNTLISLQQLIDKFWNDEVLSPELESVFKGAIRIDLEIPYSEDTKKLAANVLLNDGYYHGKHVILPNGMSSVIDILANDIEIKLNTFVTKIDYTDKKIIVHTTSIDNIPL